MTVAGAISLSRSSLCCAIFCGVRLTIFSFAIGRLASDFKRIKSALPPRGIDFIDEGFALRSVTFDLYQCLPLAASVAKCCHLPLLGRTGLG